MKNRIFRAVSVKERLPEAGKEVTGIWVEGIEISCTVFVDQNGEDF